MLFYNGIFCQKGTVYDKYDILYNHWLYDNVYIMLPVSFFWLLAAVTDITFILHFNQSSSVKNLHI